MAERKVFHGPGPETKGGGFRGGPKRWTGRGPAPARHVPWPEIFKHHISVCEGHLKMIDMVRKHTVEGSGNWKTIMACVERTQDMLHEVKRISRSFVPPPGQREQVPLGSSSASMYPGYSPADHEYGKAAEEYGRAAAKAKAMGIDITHPDVEYQIGQAKGIKRKTLAGIREAKAAREAASGSGSGSDGAGGNGGATPTAASKQANTKPEQEATPLQEATPEDEQPAFFIDTNPTPVNIPGFSNQPKKRSASPPEPVAGKKHKKVKKSHDGELPKGEDPQVVEFEDISGEVDARMKEREEKRRRKEEKKRKRLSEGETAAISEAPDTAGAIEKPKKKKSKKSGDESLADRTMSKKRAGEDAGEVGDEDGKQKKKRKKSKETVNER